MPDYTMATAAYAVLDPETGELRVSSAGHLPPIVISGGDARVVELTPAAPLGSFPYGSCQEHELTLQTGETLVLYTDGLVERPGIPLTHSINELKRIVSEASSAEEVCELAVEKLIPLGRLRDDAAIVAMHNGDIPETLHLHLDAEPRELVRVRRILRRWLRKHGADDRALMEITLAVGEACTNAIEHAYSPGPAEFELLAAAEDGEITVMIRDAGHWRTPRGAHRGRGLKIMRAAMDAVEINSGELGTEIEMRRLVRR
jgi:anti-sigma regulatory factor (Ser/Thr protein kinase)